MCSGQGRYIKSDLCLLAVTTKNVLIVKGEIDQGLEPASTGKRGLARFTHHFWEHYIITAYDDIVQGMPISMECLPRRR